MNNPPVLKREKHPRALAVTPEEQAVAERSAWQERPTTSKVKRSPSPASEGDIVCTGFENKATKRLKVTQRAAQEALVIEESMAATGSSGTRDDHESIVREQQPAQTSYAREEEDTIVEDQQPAETSLTREEENNVEVQQSPTPATTQQKEATIEAEQTPITPAPAQREEIGANVQDSSPAESDEGKTRLATPPKTFKTSTRKPKSPVRHRHRIDGRWVTCPHASPREGCGQAYYFG